VAEPGHDHDPGTSQPAAVRPDLLHDPVARQRPGRLVVVDLAMRPHNSGHWTIEGSRTSQFEQHLRAVLDYPLGATTPTARRGHGQRPRRWPTTRGTALAATVVCG